MVNCNTDSTFEALWEVIFRRLGIEPVELSPEGVRSALESRDERTLIVIDELDRLEDDDALTLLADTIKTLSDHAVGATLMLVAIAEKDTLGYFTSGQVRGPLEIIAGRYLDIPAFAKHMKEFLSPERGSVISREGKPRGYSYRFSDPMMQPYVVMSALNDGLLTEQQLADLQGQPEAPTDARPDDDPNEHGQLF
jgi:KAP family P-loop domain